MVKKTGLGRGFDSLIPTELLDESFDPTAGEDERVSDLRQIKLSEVVPDPNQPRQNFDEEGLRELAESIRQHGVVQPLVVTPHAGKYQIVAGERRYRAAKLAELDKVPALVRTLSDQHKLELSLIENLQRRDLNPLETATAYLKLRDQFNLSLEQIGKRVGGKSAPTISNTLRLLRLPETVRVALAAGALTEGQARPLIGLDPLVVKDILPTILREGWTSRRIEQYIVQIKRHNQMAAERKPHSMGDVPYQEETIRLQKRLDTDVSVRTNTRGSGQIVIKFRDGDEFERIRSLLEE